MIRLSVFILVSLMQSATGVEGPLPKPTSPPGLEVVLRPANNKTTFHLSEIVPLEVVFRAAKPATYSIEIADHWSRAPAADRFLVEPSLTDRMALHISASRQLRQLDTPQAIRDRVARIRMPTVEEWRAVEVNRNGSIGIDDSVAYSSRPDLVAAALRERASGPGFGVMRGYFELWVGVLMERDSPEAYRLPREGGALDRDAAAEMWRTTSRELLELLRELNAIKTSVAAEITGATIRSVEHQAADPIGLSGSLRTHLRDERFQIVTSIRGLPLGVRNELQTLFGGQALDIADPGDNFRATDVIVDPTLPIRRLVTAGCSSDHCLVYYERGGTTRTFRMALFHWTPAETRFEWGGIAPRGLASLDDIRKAVLSGAITGPATFW